jgi:glycosyltransferase involved in cell wall biosynthesis
MERYTLDMVRVFYKLSGQKTSVISRLFETSLKEYAWITPVMVNTKFMTGRMRDFYVDARLPGLKRRYGVDVLIGNCRSGSADIICCGGTHRGYVQSLGRAPSFYDRMIISMEQKGFDRAKHIVAHSKFIRDEIVELYGADPAKVTVLYPPTHFSPAEDPDPSRFQLSPQTVNFLFVSSSHQRKGFDLLEDFFEKTDLPVRLYVVGRDLPKDKKYKNIEYLGFFEDISSVYPSFDYSVLASSYEPFGLAPVESLMCGTPVLIAENLGCSEIIPEDLRITFERTPESFSHAVNQAVLEKTLRKEKMKNDSARIRSLFDTEEAHFATIYSMIKSM